MNLSKREKVIVATSLIIIATGFILILGLIYRERVTQYRISQDFIQKRSSVTPKEEIGQAENCGNTICEIGEIESCPIDCTTVTSLDTSNKFVTVGNNLDSQYNSIAQLVHVPEESVALQNLTLRFGNGSHGNMLFQLKEASDLSNPAVGDVIYTHRVDLGENWNAWDYSFKVEDNAPIPGAGTYWIIVTPEGDAAATLGTSDNPISYLNADMWGETDDNEWEQTDDDLRFALLFWKSPVESSE